ncbi:hypothetical protein [Zoogloea sp.]|jgi:hypothetical protein|uniref:hypothetical protein n=1 Tax=Zoogloea sp. TaxID=49181 RepID=UPI001C3E90D5|nr:hypothetical protein [Pseudomonas aeruginosa]
MSAIDAMLYFTFREGGDVGSGVVVDVATGEFDGEQAYHDMASLTEDAPAGPEGHYLQVGEHRFEVKHETGSNWTFRVIDLDGLQRVAAEMEPESEPERKSGYSSPSPF